jgi:hypothetical protein
LTSTVPTVLDRAFGERHGEEAGLGATVPCVPIGTHARARSLLSKPNAAQTTVLGEVSTVGRHPRPRLLPSEAQVA